MKKRSKFSEEEKEETREDEAMREWEPDNKRRRIQEEIGWHDDFWSSEDRASRDIAIVERDDTESEVDKWIQEIEEDMQET
eukprot:6494889-Karenia_brevis.AAC.1